MPPSAEKGAGGELGLGTASLGPRLARAVGALVTSTVTATGLGLVTLAVTAGALGPVDLGILALIEAFGRTVERLVRLEPWHAVIRYGTIRLREGDSEGFRRIVKASTLFDIAGASLAAGIALLLIWLAPGLVGGGEDHALLAGAFALSLVLSLSATPTAILRLYDRFGLLARVTIYLAAIRLLLALLIAGWGLGLAGFVWLLVFQQAAAGLVPLALGWRELRRRGLADVWRVPLTGVISQSPGLLRFVVNSNLNVILRSLTQRIDVLLVGAVLGPGATGLYHLARRSTAAAMVVGRPIQQAVYPETARLWAAGEAARFRSLHLRIDLATGVASVLALAVILPYLDPIVARLFGPDFLPAVPAIAVMGVAVALFMGGVTLNPALLSMGRDRRLVGVTLCATAAFFAALVPLMDRLGLLGAAWAHVVFNLVWLVGAWHGVLSGGPVRSAPSPTGAAD